MSCDQVHSALAFMHKQCRKDESYASKATPWTDSKLTAGALPPSVKVDMSEEAEHKIAEHLPLSHVQAFSLRRRPTFLEQHSAPDFGTH
jgi:hypothetical protein